MVAVIYLYNYTDIRMTNSFSNQQILIAYHFESNQYTNVYKREKKSHVTADYSAKTSEIHSKSGLFRRNNPKKKLITKFYISSFSHKNRS